MTPVTTVKPCNITLIGRVTKLFLTLLFTLLLAALPAAAAARVLYVAPSAEVPVRVAPESKRKIVAILADGAKVELLRTDGDWANIRTSSGREGWILKRYLSPDPPLKDQVAALKDENQRLKQRLSELQKTEKSSSTERDTCIAQRDELEREYENLKMEAADAINTRKLLERTTRELNQTKQEAALLKSQLADTENNQRLKWFLAGGGVLLTGWILGVLFRKRGRRRTSLL
jgi:SH3 domain protein